MSYGYRRPLADRVTQGKCWLPWIVLLLGVGFFLTPGYHGFARTTADGSHVRPIPAVSYPSDGDPLCERVLEAELPECVARLTNELQQVEQEIHALQVELSLLHRALRNAHRRCAMRDVFCEERISP